MPPRYSHSVVVHANLSLCAASGREMASLLARLGSKDTNPFVLLRTVGADIILTLFRHINLMLLEWKKVPLLNSRRSAALHCFIHALPVAVSVYLIVTNLNGHYIGEHLGGTHGSDHGDSIALAFIQIAAKILVNA